MVPKPTGERREKPDFFYGGGVAFDEVVSALAKLSNEGELVAFHVLNPAPCKIGGLLTGEACEVALVDQRDVGSLGREGSSRNRAVDTATDNHDIKRFRFELLQICST